MGFLQGKQQGPAAQILGPGAIQAAPGPSAKVAELRERLAKSKIDPDAMRKAAQAGDQFAMFEAMGMDRKKMKKRKYNIFEKAGKAIGGAVKGITKGTPLEGWVDDMSKLSLKKMLKDPTNLIVPGGMEYAKIQFKHGQKLAPMAGGMGGGGAGGGNVAFANMKQQGLDMAQGKAQEMIGSYIDPSMMSGLLG